MKKCERCPSPAIKAKRFCSHCQKEVLKEMKESGYLVIPPRLTFHADPKKKEDPIIRKF